MHIFGQDIDMYNLLRRVRRVGLRTAGMVVALFASNRASAVAITDVCPSCRVVGNSICNMAANPQSVNESGAVGTWVNWCIPQQNLGTTTYPLIIDSSCVTKLKNWGLCTTYPNGCGYMLYNPNLSCSSGNVNYSGVYTVLAQNGMTTVGSMTLPWTSVAGYQSSSGLIVAFQNGDIDETACCIISDTSVNYISGICMITYGTDENCAIMAACGYVPNSYTCGYMGISKTGTISGSNACPSDFESYFRTSLSTGWCDNYGSGIYVEGLGAMLISKACNGTLDTTYCNGRFSRCTCGFVLDSCNTASGYERTGKTNDPITYIGADGYCQCTSDSASVLNHVSGVTYSGYYSSGLSKCVATPSPSTVSGLSDTTGSYTVLYDGDCEWE